MNTNVLYYGDNLDILRNRDYFPDASVDLIYLDPPFNSNRSYNVLFREATGVASEAQIEAFEDTWHWGTAAAETYDDVMTGPHQDVARILKAMVDALGHNDVTAYLTMMAIRLVELHRVLTAAGSIYLHCDPTTGHYLKTLMDGVFGPRSFLNEVVWRRTYSHGNVGKNFGSVFDSLLVYTRGNQYTWNQLYTPFPQEYVETAFKHRDADSRRWQSVTLRNPAPRPNLHFPFTASNGITYHPHRNGWVCNKERLERYDREGRLHFPGSAKGALRLKMYLDESPGVRLQNIWDDIPVIGSQAAERLGYPTQKPVALLERIISTSSNPDDIVLDPFCGCGTAVHAAHKLGRRWIGVDVTHLAIGLIRRRMQDAFPDIQIEVIGEPVDLSGAHDLAKRDKYQFQWWALDRLGAQPVSGKKKGADKGIDGVIPFFAGPKDDYKRAIVSVKGGEHVTVSMVRDLIGVLEREKDPIGIFLTLAPPTKDMTTEAATAGFYDSEFWKKKFPRVQIITVEEMLGGKRPDMPWGKAPFAKAPTEKEKAQQDNLL